MYSEVAEVQAVLEGIRLPAKKQELIEYARRQDGGDRVLALLERLRFQAVHSLDVGDAYRLAAVSSDARGAFNLAADPVLDPPTLARALHARLVPVPRWLLRGAADLTWRARLQPTPPSWLDLALGVPLLDTARAHEELGWRPRFDALEAVRDLLEGMREGAGLETPPLTPRKSRAEELRTGVGSREEL